MHFDPCLPMKRNPDTIFKITVWVLFCFLAIVIGLYPIFYFVLDRNFSLLAFKTSQELNNLAWIIFFYIHITTSGIALLTGWSQFREEWRKHHTRLHRLLGKIYILAAMTGAVSGIFLGFSATGGVIPRTGFIILGLVWLLSTAKAYLAIKQKKIIRHKNLMTYSYAACFAAVTLRLWLQLFIIAGVSFTTAYAIVAWICWIPNLIVAGWIIRANKKMVG